MSKVTSTHVVEIDIFIGNGTVEMKDGKLRVSTTSQESVDHAAKKLEAVGSRLVDEAKRIQKEYS